jgi:hypothetical protein
MRSNQVLRLAGLKSGEDVEEIVAKHRSGEHEATQLGTLLYLSIHKEYDHLNVHAYCKQAHQRA